MIRSRFHIAGRAAILALAICAVLNGCTGRGTRSVHDAAADSILDEFEARQKRELAEFKKQMAESDKTFEAEIAGLKDRHAALSRRSISVGDGSSAARRLHSETSEQTEFALRRSEARAADLKRDMQDVESLSTRAGLADAEIMSLVERGGQNTRGVEELGAKLETFPKKPAK